MSFLSASRFSTPNRSTTPTPVRIARISMWVQGIGYALFVALQVSALVQVQGMSDEQLAELTEDLPQTWTSQSDVPYTQMWLTIAPVAIVAVAVLATAWRMGRRTRAVRTAALIVQGVAVLLGAFLILTGNCFGVLAVLGVVSLATLFGAPVREWYAGDTDETSDDTGK